jgi:orotate phosphoribosyltransferase
MMLAKEIAKSLLQINAVKLSPQNPFTWASGIKSPIYCDNRITLSFPAVRDLIINGFVEKSKTFEPFDIVAGVATAGIPHGALLADRLAKPFIYVREKAKSHGRQNQIEGLITEGARVLVIEDLISTGGSSLKAVEALREAGCVVVGILAIFTYGFDKAANVFKETNCPFDTLSDYDTLIAQAIDNQYVMPEELATLSAWRLSPETWDVNKN